MGSFLSGRPRTRCSIGAALILDLGVMLKRGWLVPGEYRAGSVSWASTESKKPRGAIGYRAHLTDLDDAYVRLIYSVGDVPQDYTVHLERTPCRLGGFRWWWICPRTAYRASKLYLPPGAKRFASRRAFRLGYESERGGPIDRSHHRQSRIFERLGGSYRYYDDCPPVRPKGMHHRTYERLLAELEAAMETHETIFNIGAARIIAKETAMRARQK
jgi:hypothetical protein